MERQVKVMREAVGVPEEGQARDDAPQKGEGAAAHHCPNTDRTGAAQTGRPMCEGVDETVPSPEAVGMRWRRSVGPRDMLDKADGVKARLPPRSQGRRPGSLGWRGGVWYSAALWPVDSG